MWNMINIRMNIARMRRAGLTKEKYLGKSLRMQADPTHHRRVMSSNGEGVWPYAQDRGPRVLNPEPGI